IQLDQQERSKLVPVQPIQSSVQQTSVQPANQSSVQQSSVQPPIHFSQQQIEEIHKDFEEQINELRDKFENDENDEEDDEYEDDEYEDDGYENDGYDYNEY